MGTNISNLRGHSECNWHKGIMIRNHSRIGQGIWKTHVSLTSGELTISGGQITYQQGILGSSQNFVESTRFLKIPTRCSSIAYGRRNPQTKSTPVLPIHLYRITIKILFDFFPLALFSNSSQIFTIAEICNYKPVFVWLQLLSNYDLRAYAHLDCVFQPRIWSNEAARLLGSLSVRCL